MKKIILALFMLLMLLPSMCGAVEPTIKSDKRTFNPLTGVYDLQGNVFGIIRILYIFLHLL